MLEWVDFTPNPFRHYAKAGIAPRACQGSFRAPTYRHQKNPAHRLRPDRHRPGVRVRLFGHAGLQGPARRGLRGRAGQFQSGHDHDRSGHGRPHLHRAAHLGNRRQGDRGRAARRPAADARRPDRPEPGDGPGQARRAGKVRRGNDRRQRRRDRQGRGARAVQGRRWRRSAWKSAAAERCTTLDEGREVLQADRPAVRDAAQLHAGRQRLEHGLQPRGVRPPCWPRPGCVARQPRC